MYSHTASNNDDSHPLAYVCCMHCGSIADKTNIAAITDAAASSYGIQVCWQISALHTLLAVLIDTCKHTADTGANTRR